MARTVSGINTRHRLWGPIAIRYARIELALELAAFFRPCFSRGKWQWPRAEKVIAVERDALEGER